MRFQVLMILLVALTGPAMAASGAELYKANCAACHQADGKGLPGTFPPLAGHFSDLLSTGDKGRTYVTNVLLYGVQGKITVAGKAYNGVMPAQKTLKDADVAAVLNYVATSFGNKWPQVQKPFTAADVKKLRAKTMTPAEVYKSRPAVK